MKPFSDQKTGQGAFSVFVEADGSTTTGIGGGMHHDFLSPHDAYDFHYERYMRCGDHADWNICYALCDVLDAEAA